MMFPDLNLTAFLAEYERRTNTHQFENVAPLIAEDAIFWFSDGSFRGKDAIRQVFERTWSVIREERYEIAEVEWLCEGPDCAVCIYTFRWRGRVNNEIRQGAGRGTSVLRTIEGRWQVIHEHLSPFPPKSQSA